MVEVQQLRGPLEGEPDCNPYPTTTNPSPLIASFTSFRLSSERCRSRFNRKLKGDGSSVVLEKVSKDKVAKKTKLKTIKQRSVVPHMSKGSLAGKVWETFAAVRKTRESSEIIETALIVGLDRLNVSTCCGNLNDSAFYDETDPDDADTKKISGIEKETDTFTTKGCGELVIDQIFIDKHVESCGTLGSKCFYDAKGSFDGIAEVKSRNCEGEHRGGVIAGNARSSSERGRISAYSGASDHADSMDNPSSREDISEMVQQNISSKPKTSNINRSESYKERIHHKRQLREKRKTSDPNLSKTK
ncbi:hypothetical protein K0M31_000351 [Melipona bicolor]|uniref:Uncharacterized protein n=1 Tax=Melipona bicolor TaxID=60889 RepID=A0AA40GDB7_9HYME|nr:hypothetical protein K0M31_000351 [Melipona bicolor]